MKRAASEAQPSTTVSAARHVVMFTSQLKWLMCLIHVKTVTFLFPVYNLHVILVYHPSSSLPDHN